MKNYTWVYLLLLFLLNSCTGSRSIVYVPSATPYSTEHHVASTLEESIPVAVERDSKVKEPQLTALLPVDTILTNAAHQPKYKALVTREPSRITRIALPDTSTTQLSNKVSAEQIRDADAFTTGVNIIGGVLMLIGVILVIAAFTSTSAGWLPFVFLIYGVLAMIISLPFLLFKSKYSTRRRKLDERRAARHAAKN